MTDTNNARSIGTNPITDAASATAPSNPANDSTYPVDDASDVSSNADLRQGADGPSSPWRAGLYFGQIRFRFMCRNVSIKRRDTLALGRILRQTF